MRDPHPTCVTERAHGARTVYRHASREYARTGNRAVLELATDMLCLWIESEEDARVERERRAWARELDDACRRYAEAAAPLVKPRPRWLARLLRWAA